MSIQEDCYGCRLGKHERHNPDWGLVPGLIGGSYCGCPGDCAERFAKSAAQLNDLLEASKQVQP